MNLEQHPSMPRKILSETGVVGTVALAAIAVTGVVFATGLHVGSSADRSTMATAPATLKAEPAAMARAGKAPSPSAARGAELDADQPFYDESAGVLIKRR